MDADDVISVDRSNDLLSGSTFRVKEVTNEIVDRLRVRANRCWLEDGVNCEMLNHKTGGWKKGKIRISLEFIPDEPEPQNLESPLDDLREQVNQTKR